ncbi:DUF1549 domain-containing protein [Lignipirellula cremea]|uniref:DUF1549 domain-containing protein n=1 Tax=Lignipirellula cremea TaxID=2528010 RepID=A0A518DKJ2_9BACT|nr:DUF1549 domain-containing protein [Lignipirellula cremea]QDU92349.1 hypothetical protein Pla8534_00950 [Lignipirellula cremea]
MNALFRDTLLAGSLLCLLIGGSFRSVAAQDEGKSKRPTQQGAVAPPLHQRIDDLIERRLEELKISAAMSSSDAEFVRRVFLDLTGVIPSARQARSFLDDAAPDKRQRLIDALLARPEHAIHMARVFDVMLIERRIPAITSYDVASATWRAYLTEAFAENRPWDRMVRDILASDGTGDQHAAGVKFYLVRDVAPHQLTRDVGRLFLGVDLQCAQCHDDPRIDAYRQAEYFGIYAFLERVTAFRDTEKNVSLVGEKADGKTTFVSVFTALNGETSPQLPGGEMIADPPLERGKEYVNPPGPKQRGIPVYSRRNMLAELLPRAETEGFARNLANRLWALLIGRGIVHPLDLYHSANPPSHPELLELLEHWLVEHDFDMQGLLRELALSQTYQRSSVLPAGAASLPDDSFAAAPLRGLTAEQLSWSVLQATGRVEQHLHQIAEKQSADKAKSADATPDDQSADAMPAWRRRLTQYEPLERQVKPLVAVFAGLPGQPDGDFQPVVDQALYLLNSPAMLPLLRDPPSTLLPRLTAIAEPEPLAEELYLSVLSRRPTAEEIAEVRRLVEPLASSERRQPLLGLIWGLLLSSEFRLNH